MAGLYIHIPFCASRCIYCDFYSTTGRNRSHFIERLLEEAQKAKESNRLKLPSYSFQTVYIGGGTPSQLQPQELSQLVDGLANIFDLTDVNEFTLEVNPEDITPEYVNHLPSSISRVSMGVQSFVDNELHILRRRHNAQQPKKAIQLLKDRGIQNISIDLMYGLPMQTLESFDYSISQALSLNIQHISAYNLSVEQGTPLDKLIKSKGISIGDDDLCNRMNLLLRNKLSKSGFVQYEISNYSLPDYESKHNSSYWDGTPYLGLGPGAHSYDGNNRRWWNEPNLTEYLAGNFTQGEELLNEHDLYNEMIMLGLRTRKGVDITLLQHKHPSLYNRVFSPNIEKINPEYINIKDGKLIIASSYLHLTDTIISQLFSVQ